MSTVSVVVPPFDSVEYPRWAGSVSAHVLRSVCDPQDYLILSYLRNLIKAGHWHLGGNDHSLQPFEVLEIIAKGIRNGHLLVTHCPWFGEAIRDYRHPRFWLIDRFDSHALQWLQKCGKTNTVAKTNAGGSGRKFRRWDEKPKPEPMLPSPVLATPAQVAQTQVIQVAFQIVDDVTGDPIPNVALTVTLPDESEHQLTTDSSGTVKLSCAKPGEIALTCDHQQQTWQQTATFVTTGEKPSGSSQAEPNQNWSKDIQCIAVAVQHQAMEGDTLQSIATANGVSEDRIAQFNWAGTDPQSVKQGMQDAGATQEDKAGNEFFGKDDSGMIWVPDDWVLKCLPSGQGGLLTHVLRVQPITVTVKFAIQLQDNMGNSLSDVNYEVILYTHNTDQKIEQTFSDRSADGKIVHDIDPRCNVALLEYWTGENREDSIVNIIEIGNTNPRKGRLSNLGYFIELNEDPSIYNESVAAFKLDQGLKDDCNEQELETKISELS